MLKKVQTQRESPPENITETIHSLPMVERLRLSSGHQFQNKEYYKTEIEVLGYSWIFCQMKEMLSLPVSLLIAPTQHIFILYMLSWFLPFYTVLIAFLLDSPYIDLSHFHNRLNFHYYLINRYLLPCTYLSSLNLQFKILTSYLSASCDSSKPKGCPSWHSFYASFCHS